MTRSSPPTRGNDVRPTPMRTYTLPRNVIAIIEEFAQEYGSRSAVIVAAIYLLQSYHERGSQ